MNYRHIYHAGNFADIVKHLVLIAILEQLKNKEKPFAVLDAFAGLGLYDLTSEAASKTLEHTTGISQLLKSTTPPPKLLQTFLNIVNSVGFAYKEQGAKPITNRRATSNVVGESKSIDYI